MNTPGSRFGGFATALLLLGAHGAGAATMIESRIGDQPIFVVSDPDTGRVLVAGVSSAQLVDLDTATVYLIPAGAPAQMVRMAALPPDPGYSDAVSVERIGPGDRIAGLATMRYRIALGGRVCSHVDANLALAQSMPEAVRAFALLDRLNSVTAETGLTPCQQIPYAAYNWIGWGLRVIDADAPEIEATAVHPHFHPDPGLMALPADAQDITGALVGHLTSAE